MRRWITILIVGVFVLGAAAVYMWQSGMVSGVQSDLKDTGRDHRPKFVFDSVAQAGWWTAGTTWPDPKDADSNTPQDVVWPIASISVHQCKDATRCKDPAKDTIGAHCFVMAFYQKGNIDPERALADMQIRNKKWGMTTREVGTETITMDTPEGRKQYQLHQFDYDMKDEGDFKRGNGQGYVVLKDGYIDVRSVCDAADQLGETVPALQAIRLER